MQSGQGVFSKESFLMKEIQFNSQKNHVIAASSKYIAEHLNTLKKTTTSKGVGKKFEKHEFLKIFVYKSIKKLN